MAAQFRKTPTSFRLLARALRLLKKSGVHTGIGSSACLEVAIRELARQEKIDVPVWFLRHLMKQAVTTEGKTDLRIEFRFTPELLRSLVH